MQRFLGCGFVIIAVWALAFEDISHAVPMLDQSYTASPDATGFVGLNNFIDRSQTFTVGISGILTQVDLLNFQRNSATTDALLFDIRTTSGGVPTEPDSGGNILASLSLAAASVSTTFGTLSVDLSPFSVSVASGDVLAIVLSSDDPVGGAYRWRGTSADGYVGGSAFDRLGATWGSTFFADHTFQTFVESTDLPLPGTLPLLGIGLVGMVFGAWRKRKSAA